MRINMIFEKTNWLVILALIWLYCSGCGADREYPDKVATFLEPTYTDASKTNDDRIVGIWINKANSITNNLIITNSALGGYKVTIVDQNVTIVQNAVLYRINGDKYLDITTDGSSASNGIAFLTQIPGHLVFKIRIRTGELSLTIVDYYKLADLVRSEPLLFDHYSDGYRIVITSPSLRIQEVLGSRKNDEALFNEKNETTFVKKP